MLERRSYNEMNTNGISFNHFYVSKSTKMSFGAHSDENKQIINELAALNGEFVVTKMEIRKHKQGFKGKTKYFEQNKKK